MAVNKKYDKDSMQGFKGKLKRRFDSGVGDRTVPSLYFKNLSGPSFEMVLFGFVGMMAGSIGLGFAYDELEHKTLETEIAYGLDDTTHSYQGIGDLLIEHTSEGQYAVYNNGRDADGDFTYEYDYLQRPGDALGALYNIRTELRTIAEKISQGQNLEENELQILFAVSGLTTLHEEETGSIEREIDVLMPVMSSPEAMAAKIETLLPMIDDAIATIYDGGAYGLPQSQIDNRESTLSVDGAVGRGLESGGALYVLLLLGASLNGARIRTRNQMRRAREGKPKDPRPFL